MKREPVRTILLYILTFVLIFLVVFLIHFVITYDKGLSKKTGTCVFESNTSEFNYFMSDNQMMSLCDGYNDINVKVDVGGKTVNVKATIYNGDDHVVGEKDGLYINGNKVASDTYTSGFSNLFVFGDILYVLNSNDNLTDLFVYSGDGEQIYDLSSVLSQANISDKAFEVIAETDNSFNTIITNAHLDSKSFKFDETGFTFNSDIGRECNVNEIYSGSNYKVNYSNNEFGNPTFVNYVECRK